MSSLYQKALSPETRSVPPEVIAQIIHRFMERVQAYTEQMLSQKWEALEAKKGMDPTLLFKFNDWLTYQRFNAHTLEEIENGTLDDWFRNLFSEGSPRG
jgi:hypothetical protein